MKISRTHLVYFSPTGTTRKVLNILAKQLPGEVRQYDLTDPDCETPPPFDAEDLVIFGIPVYSGRVPKTAALRFQSLSGNQTPAVLVATYGNRDYDDALLELKNMLEPKGFRAAAAAAVVTEHSIVREIAAGRPDISDMRALGTFAKEAVQKITGLDSLKSLNLTVKGNPNYREYKVILMHPHGTSRCIKCGSCVKHCPVRAIPADDPRKTDRERCISCMRCVRICPKKARVVPKLMQWGAKRMLLKKCTAAKKPEFFL